MKGTKLRQTSRNVYFKCVSTTKMGTKREGRNRKPIQFYYLHLSSQEIWLGMNATTREFKTLANTFLSMTIISLCKQSVHANIQDFSLKLTRSPFFCKFSLICTHSCVPFFFLFQVFDQTIYRFSKTHHSFKSIRSTENFSALEAHSTMCKYVKYSVFLFVNK